MFLGYLRVICDQAGNSPDINAVAVVPTPKLTGCATESFLEQVIEVGQIVEAHGIADFRYLQVSPDEHAHCVGQTQDY